MNKIDAIIDIIKSNWSTNELVNAWNLRCEKKEYMDEFIEDMSFFDEIFQNLSPLEIVDKVRGCNFRTEDDYFAFNGYGNPESFSYVEDYSRFSYDELAEYLADNGDSLTKKVDSDELLAYFVEEYFDDDDNVRDILSTIIEEGDEPFDLLMDDWDDLFEAFKNIIKNK